MLEEGRPRRSANLLDHEREAIKTWFFLSTKPTIYAANVDEATLTNPESNPHVRAVIKHAASEQADVVFISAKLEAELVALDPAERDEYLKDLGLSSSGVDKLIKAAYHMLGLMSLTAGEKEVGLDDPDRHKSTAGRRRGSRTSNAARPLRSCHTMTSSRAVAAKSARERPRPRRRQRIHNAGRRRCRFSI